MRKATGKRQSLSKRQPFSLYEVKLHISIARYRCGICSGYGVYGNLCTISSRRVFLQFRSVSSRSCNIPAFPALSLSGAWRPLARPLCCNRPVLSQSSLPDPLLYLSMPSTRHGAKRYFYLDFNFSFFFYITNRLLRSGFEKFCHISVGQ